LTGKLRWGEADKYGDFLASAFTRDGTILLTAEGSPSRLRVWDAKTGQPIAGPIPLQHGTVGNFTALPDGKSLASANTDGTLQIWDVSNPTEPRALGRPLRGQFGQVNALALSADGKTLYSGSLDGSVYAWDTIPAQSDQSRFLLTGIFDWGFAPGNRSILTIDPQGRVSRREGPDFQLNRPLLDTGSDLVRVRDQAEFSSDGKFLATSRDGVVRVWDIQTGGPTPRLVTLGRFAANSLAPDGKLLIIYDDGRDSVEEWDLNTFQKLRSWANMLPSRTGAALLALSTGGKYLLNVSAGGDEALIRDVATGQASAWTNLGAGSVRGVSFSADGALFAVGGDRGLAQVWETTRSRPRVASVGHQQLPIWAVSFSRDGSRLVTASDGSDALTLWDIARGTELLRLEAGGDRFQSPRFSFDDTLLGCVNWQNELYLWRAPSWAEIETVEKANVLSR
jgi:WD40 repeat protein